MHASRFLIPALLSSTLLLGCGSGSTSPNPNPTPNTPQVIGIAPSGMVGTIGEEVTFDVTTTRPASTYSWEFAGGVSPTQSTESTPAVMLESEGVFQGSVTVCAGGDCADPFAFSFEVHSVQSELDPPHISTVVPSGQVGVSAGEVTFSALATNSPTSWTWSFGAGAVPSTSTAAEPVVTLQLPGLYTGSVIASNAAGDSVAFPFSYTVGTPSIPGFATPYKIDSDPSTFNSEGTALLLDGKPVIVYGDASGSSQTLRVAMASTATPSAPGDWTIQKPAESATGHRNGMLATAMVLDGKLHIAHYLYDTTTETMESLLYTRATVASPSGPSDWTTHAIASVSADAFMDLVDLEGIPVIAASDGTNTPVLRMADSSTPSSASDWMTLALPDSISGQPNANVIDGRLGLALAGPDGLKYAESTGSDLDTAGWSVMTLSTTEGQGADLTTHLSKPVLVAGLGQPMFPYIGIASVAHPTSASDFAVYQLDTDTWSGGQGMRIVSAAGRLVATYNDAEPHQLRLRVVRALIGTPTAANQWQSVDAITSDNGYNVMATDLVPTPNGFGLVYASTFYYNPTWLQQNGTW